MESEADNKWRATRTWGELQISICNHGKLVHHSNYPNASITQKWCTKQIDFVLVYPQVPIEYDLFMKLLMVLIIKGANQKTCCLQLLKNIYDHKQAERVWNKYLM